MIFKTSDPDIKIDFNWRIQLVHRYPAKDTGEKEVRKFNEIHLTEKCFHEINEAVEQIIDKHFGEVVNE